MGRGPTLKRGGRGRWNGARRRGVAGGRAPRRHRPSDPPAHYAPKKAIAGHPADLKRVAPWQFRIDAEQEGTQLPRPRNSPLGQLIPSVTAFLNADRGPLPTWRYALGGTAEIVTRSGRERREYTFARQSEPVGIGFANTVDAMVVTVAVPQSVGDFRLESDAGRLRQLRTDRFTAIARQELEDYRFGPFAAGWITDVALSVAASAVQRGDGITGVLGLGPQQWLELAGAVVTAFCWLSTTQNPMRPRCVTRCSTHCGIRA